MPLFGTELSASDLTRGFASQPYDWFTFIGEGSEIIYFSGWGVKDSFLLQISFPECLLYIG